MVLPSTPELPWLERTRCHACSRFSRSHTSSIRDAPVAGSSGSRFAVGDSVPSRPASGVSPRPSVMKASGSCSYWIFGRMSPMSREAYWPLPSFGPSSVVPGLADLLPRLSASGCLNGLADSTAYYALCRLLRRDGVASRLPQSFAGVGRLETRRRPPEVSSTAFPAHLPDLHPRPLMDEDFAVSRPLVRPGLPHIR